LKKILITGASGYIGARLSRDLAKAGYRVTVFIPSDLLDHQEWISLMDEVIIGDIRDERIINRLSEYAFDSAIHLISLDNTNSQKSPNFVSSINILPTWNLLDTLSNAGLKQFIYFSTIHVYGDLPNKKIFEDQLTNPKSIYGLTHLLSEKICNYFNNNTKTKCINVRLSNSYGPPVFNKNNCWSLAINDFCKSAFLNKKINLLSDGLPLRDFIYGDDVSKAISCIIENNEINNIIHLASGETFTILELAEQVKNIYQIRYNKEIDILINKGNKNSNQSKSNKYDRFEIDTAKLQSTGFKPSFNLTKGINETFNYLELNSDQLLK